MASLNLLKEGNYKQETKGGVLGIEIHADHSVMMDQFLPVFSEIVEVLHALQPDMEKVEVMSRRYHTAGYHIFAISSSDEAADLTIRQGYSMKKPSEIKVSLTIENNEIVGVKVGGSAMKLELKEIEI